MQGVESKAIGNLDNFENGEGVSRSRHILIWFLMIYPQLLLRAVDDEDEANHIMYLSSAKGKVLRKSGGSLGFDVRLFDTPLAPTLSP
jgi:hypothetical protein